ncbi:uncharacterized protein L201_005515 [Kwoniella dendrophila CBS 6074]|uniref:HbrB-like protein n=1 Tax=Kwoniella dendrophila CBS 6074 TaxID=1295534 RepID=A0AAX4K0D4_9TREE
MQSSNRAPTFRKPSNLSIRPPSPNHNLNNNGPYPPALTTPTGTYQHQYTYGNVLNSNTSSPRRTALPPSPTYSNVSYASKGSSSGLGVGPKYPEEPIPPPPLPSKNNNNNEKRLPTLPGQDKFSPHKYVLPSGTGKGWATGAYDNKLVSSTLSHLPPIPPLSPAPNASSSSSLHPTTSSTHLHPSPRPSISNQSSTGIVVYPDGTPITDHHDSHHHGIAGKVAEHMTMAHSSPNSPWSLLTVHVLPLFAGSALKTPLEDLNHLCHSHIISTSQRYPPARIVSLLTADLREFIASGMLTLKAKFETLEEGKVVSRAAEVWIFFWAQVLPYVEGVFLPFTQLRDVPTSSSSSYLTTLSSSIPVRHLILSGFLLHILLPLLPRLVPQITNPPSPTLNSYPPPTTTELSKILQMSLVLSTQARYSTFFPSSGQEDRDEEVRDNVESLGKAVRWKLQQNEIESQLPIDSDSPIKASPNTNGVVSGRSAGGGLQRGPSLSQSGRYRRKGWRASANLGMLGLSQYGNPNENSNGKISRQNSGEPNTNNNNAYFSKDNAHRNRLDEEDEDDSELGLPPQIRANTNDSLAVPSLNVIPGGSMLSSVNDSSTITGGSTIGDTIASSTITGGSTIRGESLASYGETPSASMTPSVSNGIRGVPSGEGVGGMDMMYGRPVRRGRAESEGSEVAGTRRI